MWDEDVKYFYYQHGPLSRTELGDEKVQGIDYAYTLQGWLKGINSSNLNASNDIGKDGDTRISNISADKYVCKDGYSYGLNYYIDKVQTGSSYRGDYQAIGSTGGSFMASISGAAYLQTDRNLYNGNISSMSTTLMHGDTVQPQLATKRMSLPAPKSERVTSAGPSVSVKDFSLRTSDAFTSRISRPSSRASACTIVV
ncbi:MAG TPA: hypothetical protein VLB84_01855, partial [Bacteroidia bacterium]|nr:hypothetical protein [Bacteroidia bacterium]